MPNFPICINFCGDCIVNLDWIKNPIIITHHNDVTAPCASQYWVNALVSHNHKKQTIAGWSHRMVSAHYNSCHSPSYITEFILHFSIHDIIMPYHHALQSCYPCLPHDHNEWFDTVMASISTASSAIPASPPKAPNRDCIELYLLHLKDF